MFDTTTRFNGLFAVLLAGGLVFATGCGGGEDAGEGGGDNAASNNSNTTIQSVMLEEAPEGAQSIADLKASAEEGDEVVVRVVVGGSVSPFVDGRASVKVVDASVENSCLDEDDHCETPWDYCCQIDERNAGGATVQIVDAEGRVLDGDLSESFSELATLTVVGTVGPRPNNDVLVINATGIYVGEQAQ